MIWPGTCGPSVGSTVVMRYTVVSNELVLWTRKKAYVFFGVMNGDRRSESGSLGVKQFVGHLEARRKPAWEALLVFGGAQPEVDLKFGLDHPAACADSATTRELNHKSEGKICDLNRISIIQSVNIKNYCCITHITAI